MKKVLFIFLITTNCFSQSLYFPPLLGPQWDTISPVSLGWCPDKIDTLINFLGQKNTKAFIVLQDGKIAIEKYYGTFTKDSIWYWASAGKSLAGFLTGIAQEEGFVNINDSTSKYLGTGWTACTPTQEGAISILNQLTMTTGLNDGVPDDHCTIDSCLVYLAPVGTRWAYHNAPYTLLHHVVENASGITWNNFTQTRISNHIGMFGLWFTSNYDEIYYSTARSMARFGLAILNNGIWNGDTLLHDTAYFSQMKNTSQNLNKAYGYLWWLNGKSSYMVPGVQFVFPGYLVPSAPADMFAALGKNDQKIHVVPSKNMVVVRMGNAADSSLAAITNFDDQIWQKLNDVFCAVGVNQNGIDKNLVVFPNPSSAEFMVSGIQFNVGDEIILANVNGKISYHSVFKNKISELKISTKELNNGIYFLELKRSNSVIRKKIVVLH